MTLTNQSRKTSQKDINYIIQKKRDVEHNKQLVKQKQELAKAAQGLPYLKS